MASASSTQPSVGAGACKALYTMHQQAARIICLQVHESDTTFLDAFSSCQGGTISQTYSCASTQTPVALGTMHLYPLGMKSA